MEAPLDLKQKKQLLEKTYAALLRQIESLISRNLLSWSSEDLNSQEIHEISGEIENSMEKVLQHVKDNIMGWIQERIQAFKASQAERKESIVSEVMMEETPPKDRQEEKECSSFEERRAEGRSGSGSSMDTEKSQNDSPKSKSTAESSSNGTKYEAPKNEENPDESSDKIMLTKRSSLEGDDPCENGPPRFEQGVIKVLKDWLKEHADDPYPSADEKVQLVKATGLSIKQIQTWFVNARGRFWKNTKHRNSFGRKIERTLSEMIQRNNEESVRRPSGYEQFLPMANMPQNPFNLHQ